MDSRLRKLAVLSRYVSFGHNKTDMADIEFCSCSGVGDVSVIAVRGCLTFLAMVSDRYLYRLGFYAH